MKRAMTGPETAPVFHRVGARLRPRLVTRPAGSTQSPPWRRFVGLVLLLAGIFPAGATAVDSWNIDLSGSIPGYLRDVQIAGDIAYCGVGSGLLVLDVQPGIEPRQIAFQPLQDVSLVAVEGDYAYLAAGEQSSDAGLITVDVSIPAAPVTLGRSGYLHAPSDLVVNAGHAYVADSYQGLRIFDLGDPTSPEPIGYLPLNIRTCKWIWSVR